MKTARQLPESPHTDTGDAILASEIPCEAEPIRIPGAIQPHGFLILTDPQLNTIKIASETAERYLGLPLRLILGSGVDGVFEREMLSVLQLLRMSSEPQQGGMSTFLGSFRISGQFFSVATHRVGQDHVLEFELQDRLVGPEMMNGVITNFVGKLSRLQTPAQLCDELTRQVADLTHFDRVLLYTFDDEGHGTVISEVNNGVLPSYLGLRFPASDIPRQARELYVLNTTRVIPDASYEASSLRGFSGQDAAGLDLSLSLLRSVSPVHLKYMQNMGTQASMSVSLVMDGGLWGLISAHNAQPRLVPFLVRSACDMLSKVGSTQLSSFATADRLRQTVHLHAVQRNVVTALAGEPNYLEGLARVMPQALEVTNADGVALILEDRVVCHGQTPGDEDVRRIGKWLEEQGEIDFWSSSHAGTEQPWAEEIRDTASGVIAIRISSVQKRYLLWFRPEIVKTVRWAGEPVKVMESNQILNPRNSFAEWKETVRGQSRPWSDVELESARDFRSALTNISLRRAEEAVELGEARFQQLTQALPVRVFTADDSGRLTYTNQQWQATGMGDAGRWFEEAHLVEDDAERCADQWSRAVAANRTFEAEVRLRTGSGGKSGGGERWNFVRVVPFHRAGAERAGWIGCFIDLTESKEREMALRINEKLALTGRMTSVIAHEINNPLEAITNLMYLLRSEIDTEGPAVGYIGLVESELERISGITKQTLRWNRESANARESFRAGLMVDDVLRLFRGKTRNRQITTKVLGDREMEFSGVVGQLRQVLANLFSNALDAAPVGGEVTVRILGKTGDEHVGYEVEDNGKGIPIDAQKRLFEPFYSTKGDLGNGLGLYISHEIIERHGGTIEVVASSPGKTQMRFLVPSHGPPVIA